MILQTLFPGASPTTEAREDVPAEVLATVRRLAHGAARQGWGDEDDMLSAAHYGIALCLHRHEAAGRPGLPPSGQLITYAIYQIRAVRCANAKRRARRRPAAKPYGPPPPEIAQEQEFWQVACEDLTPRQADMLRLVHRVGMSCDEAGRRLGVSGQRVRQAMTRALPIARRSLLFAYGGQPRDLKGGAA